jgi:acyl-CoA synthetase (AMP-forming)/AMP-acid ligase II
MDLVSWTFGRDCTVDDVPLLLDPENTSRSLSFIQLRSLVKQLIAGLAHVGIVPGDCVMVNSFNDIFYTVLYLGVVGSGAIFTGVNPSYTSSELAHHMQLTKPKLLIVEAELFDKTLVAAKEIGRSVADIFLFDRGAPSTARGVQPWTCLLRYGEKDWIRVPDPTAAVIQYASTSGTSGLPKVAQITHEYHVSQANNLLHDYTLPYAVSRLLPLPPFHTFATPIVPASIRMGYPVYIMRRFHMDKFFEYVKKYRISETYLPPPVLTQMPHHPCCTPETLQSIKQIWFGGAMLKYSSRLPIYDVLVKDAKIQPVWGMTEAGWITAGQWPEKFTDDSVARLLPDFKIKVVDDDDAEIKEPGEVGELVAKSPAPMLGYLNNPSATEEMFDARGWIRTGDIGYLKDGKVFVVDRKKDIIKVRGWQVSPAEIEAVLLQHPAVVDVAVAGTSSESGMGGVKAFVVLESGSDTNAENIQEFAGQRLAKYKIPAEVAFVDAIPKNTTGKILRRLLK